MASDGRSLFNQTERIVGAAKVMKTEAHCVPTRPLLSVAAFVVGLGLASGASSQEPTFPTTQREFYQAGQQFAYCSAYFHYGAGIARNRGLNDSAVAIEGMERGWSLAGLLLLTEGLDESRQTEAETTFETMKQIKLDQIKGRREMGQVNGGDDYVQEWMSDYQEECGPWSDMQKAIIQAMRSGPTS